ncbi:aryl-sulfate sulfotransferase [Flavobacteriales bacterium]|nr:aryl-sulfate sulfotransferase [Flavobacteriales bacterium]
MKKLLLTLLCLPSLVFSQVNYTVTVNTPDSWQANLFFQRGGTPQKPVKIIDPSITEIYSQNLGMKGWDFKVNYNNKISYFDRSSKGWFIMDSLQNEIDSVYCLNGYTADNHDFLALPNGNYVLFAYDEQPYAMDTVVVGGDPNAMVEGLIIQELDANHNLVFEWKSWDHFHITDNAYMSPWTGANLPFIHANAIDIDFDGHFLISCRGLDEITKIHRTTGEVIWRWGGTQNEFTFVNDYPFTHQHSIKSLGNNRYILYDNGNYSAQYTGTINISRAVEYELDTNLMEATKVWEFVHPDSLYTPSIGGVQRLPNGNTLIDFGNLQWLNIGSIVTEVDPNNQIVFQLEYANGGNLYRAQKFDWFFYTPTLGCTDSLACNYDPLVTIDDGSCVYPVIWQQTYSICDGVSVVIGSSIYNTTGNYIDSLNASNGCDSIVYTYLFVDQNTTSYDTLSVNASIVWNGMPLNLSGDYSATLINSVGCDSIANLNLIITTTSLFDITQNKNNLVQITDMLGQEIPYRRNTLLFYIYDDGTVEKKIIIE